MQERDDANVDTNVPNPSADSTANQQTMKVLYDDGTGLCADISARDEAIPHVRKQEAERDAELFRLRGRVVADAENLGVSLNAIVRLVDELDTKVKALEKQLEDVRTNSAMTSVDLINDLENDTDVQEAIHSFLDDRYVCKDDFDPDDHELHKLDEDLVTQSELGDLVVDVLNHRIDFRADITAEER